MSTAIEKWFSGFWILTGIWATAFSWFTTYLTELHYYSGSEWIFSIVCIVFGATQFYAAHNRIAPLRITCAMIAVILFMWVTILITKARTVAGMHAYALPYCAATFAYTFLCLIVRGDRD